MKVRIVETTALFPKGNLIQWSMDDATGVSGTFLFSVYRSGGYDGPWETLAEGLTDQYAYLDEFPRDTSESRIAPNYLNLFRPYVYKVECTAPTGEVLTAIDDTSPRAYESASDRKMAQIHRKLVRDFILSLKFNGTKVAFLKRRRWGERCSCVDKKSKEIVRGSCTKCWGVGILGGYWAPTLSYVRRSVSTTNSTIMPTGKSDSSDNKMWMPPVPSVEQDDLIVFLKDQRRLRLDQTTNTEIRLQAVHQVVSGQEIDHSNILYRIPVNTSDLEPLF